MVQLGNFLKPVMKKKVFSQVWQITKKIPQGKLATYGQIARSLRLKDARVVGWALCQPRSRFALSSGCQSAGWVS